MYRIVSYVSPEPTFYVAVHLATHNCTYNTSYFEFQLEVQFYIA